MGVKRPVNQPFIFLYVVDRKVLAEFLPEVLLHIYLRWWLQRWLRTRWLQQAYYNN